MRGTLIAALVCAGLGMDATPGVSQPTSSSEAADERAEALIDQWIATVGGMEAYWGLQSATYTLTTQMYDASSGRLRRTRPRYVAIARLETGEAARIERWEGDDFIAQGFDGQDVIWATMNGEPLAPGDKDFDEALYVGRDVFYWVSLPYKLKDPGVFLHYDGKDEAGRDLVRVAFGEDVGEHDDTWFYTFEEGRSIPVTIAYREEGRENVNLTRWEDIQEFDGYFIPGRRVHVNDMGQITKVLVTTDFVKNPTLEANRFRTP
ncbi:MAG: hypothetical protein ACR2QM_12725 [Longimicrobiales bacterium]